MRITKVSFINTDGQLVEETARPARVMLSTWFVILQTEGGVELVFGGGTIKWRESREPIFSHDELLTFYKALGGEGVLIGAGIMRRGHGVVLWKSRKFQVETPAELRPEILQIFQVPEALEEENDRK